MDSTYKSTRRFKESMTPGTRKQRERHIAMKNLLHWINGMPYRIRQAGESTRVYQSFKRTSKKLFQGRSLTYTGFG